MPDLLSWMVGEGVAPPSVAPIHRLDRQTSGVVLASTDPALRGEMGRWFAERRVDKVYRCLVHGRPHKGGTISRALVDGRRQAPLPATTRFKRLGVHGRFSYLEIVPETGRKHQIRKHLNLIGHPIVGDRRYRPPKAKRQLPPGTPNRLWLHALSLSLPDGRRFEAPLASELAAHLERLR